MTSSIPLLLNTDVNLHFQGQSLLLTGHLLQTQITSLRFLWDVQHIYLQLSPGSGMPQTIQINGSNVGSGRYLRPLD